MDKEIIEGFQTEAKEILSELSLVVEFLENVVSDFPADKLTEFAQKIDRIMGTAKTLEMESPNHAGLTRIGKIAELCKSLGYSASQLKIPEVIPIFAAFWADTLDIISELIESLEDERKTEAISNRFSLVLQKRLTWLSDKVKVLGKTSASKGVSQLDVDALLKQFQ